jgi:hypothetical protein
VDNFLAHELLSADPSGAGGLHHLTTRTIIGMSKWRMEIARAKTRTSSVAEIISRHSGPSPSGNILMENMTNADTMQKTPNQIKNGGT